MNNLDSAKLLRVSVATLNRVIFPHPQGGVLLLAMERKATVRQERVDKVRVQAQPFGGGVHILDPLSLQKIVGKIHFDSEHSEREGDFRILIPCAARGAVKRYCLRQFEKNEDDELETTPRRELVEEFGETLGLMPRANQYIVRAMGVVVEDNRVETGNSDSCGPLTVRIYRIFDVRLVDKSLCQAVLSASTHISDQVLGELALEDARHGGRGWANAALALPLKAVTDAYLAISPELRYRKIIVENHVLDESVLAVLWDIDVPQYRKENITSGRRRATRKARRR